MNKVLCSKTLLHRKGIKRPEYVQNVLMKKLETHFIAVGYQLPTFVFSVFINIYCTFHYIFPVEILPQMGTQQRPKMKHSHGRLHYRKPARKVFMQLNSS